MMILKQFFISLFMANICFVSLSQPPGKHWEAVAYNQHTRELAVFSGTELKGNKWFLTDSLWLFKGKWRFVDGNGIRGRWAHGLVYHDNALYTYGGLTYNAQQQEVMVNDLLRFKESWSKETEGPKLSLPTLFSLKGKLLLTGQPHDDLKSFEVWELVGNTFQRRSSVNLGERDGVRSLIVQKDLVLVYPSDSGLTFQNLTTGHITVVRDLPKRTKFGITYSAHTDSYFLFGGLDEKRNLSNDFWQIKNGFPTKITVENTPSPRASFKLLPTAKGLILYGGVEDGGKLSNEVWEYEKGKWRRM